MIAYPTAKGVLMQRGFDTKYFTEEFYRNFVMERRDAILHIGEGAKFVRTKKSKLFNKTNATYCEFVEIFNSSLATFRFKHYEGEVLVAEVIGEFDNAAEARAVANAIEESTGRKLEVDRI